MPFDNAVLTDFLNLPAGEVIKSFPHAVNVFEKFEDGLVEGRFCKYDSGQADNLDGSATPTLAGVVRRKLVGEIGDGVYSTSGEGLDQVAEVCTFGWVTVTVTDAATPEKYNQVYTVNAATADAGKATDDAGQLLVPGAIFWEEKQTGVWLVRINMGVENATAYITKAATLDVSAVDNADGTATLTIQAQNGVDGSNLAENVLARVWVGDADDFGVDAITGITVVDGTSKEEVTANGEYLVITDATGLATLTLNNGGAGTIYAWSELSGFIYPSGAIAITV